MVTSTTGNRGENLPVARTTAVTTIFLGTARTEGTLTTGRIGMVRVGRVPIDRDWRSEEYSQQGCTSPGDGVRGMTGWKMSEGYHRKTNVVIWMNGWAGGGIITRNDLWLGRSVCREPGSSSIRGRTPICPGWRRPEPKKNHIPFIYFY